MKRLFGACLCVGLAAIAVLVLRGLAPRQVAADVLIEETGRYRSPVGDCLVDVWQETEGQLKFFVYRQEKAGRTGNGPSKPFRAASDWLMCWDAHGRLWTYVPEQDLQYCRYWSANTSCRVGSRNGLRGIPEPFFARLPDIVKGTYGGSLRAQRGPG